jgi:putative restriction endonuclease
LDKLFDKGLIAFADDGTLLKHSAISWEQLKRIGVTPDDKLRVVHTSHHRFLAAHRAANGYSLES